MTVLVDDRAGSKELVCHAPLSAADAAVLCRLNSGDVALSGSGPNSRTLSIGVEFKSISDLIASCQNGRYQASQLPAMQADYDIVWLLYYGVYRCGSRGELEVRRGKFWQSFSFSGKPIPWAYLEHFILTLAAVGVHTKHVEDVAAAARWVAALDSWWSRPWEKHKSMHTFDRSQDVGLIPGMPEGLRRRAEVARVFSGLGFERAVAAGKHFRSVKQMVNADAAEWVKVEGIGKVVARSVVQEINEEV